MLPSSLSGEAGVPWRAPEYQPRTLGMYFSVQTEQGVIVNAQCDSFPTLNALNVTPSLLKPRSSPILPERAPTFRKMGIFAAMELLEHVQHQDSTQHL